MMVRLYGREPVISGSSKGSNKKSCFCSHGNGSTLPVTVWSCGTLKRKPSLLFWLGRRHETKGRDKWHHLHSGPFSTSGNTESKQKNQFSRSLQSNAGTLGGSRSRVLKSQVCSCNKTVLPTPRASSKWGHRCGNRWKLSKGRWDAAGPSDWGRPAGSTRCFPTKVLVNFGKRRSLPLLPIRDSRPYCFPANTRRPRWGLWFPAGQVGAPGIKVAGCKHDTHSSSGPLGCRVGGCGY